jgi:outer membrane protein OmpA-like peptidoglycan-associated protein
VLRIFLALFTAALVAFMPAAPAVACGVKLTVKAPRVKKRVDRSDHPSRILLLGEPPRTLAVALSRAGHTVDVAEEPESAQSKRYDLVVADPEQVDEARSNYPGTQVVTRTGSSQANVREVERVLAREDGKGPPRDRAVARRDQDKKPTRLARETPTGPRRVTTTETPRRNPDPAPTRIETTTDTRIDTTPTNTENESEPTRLATIPRDRSTETETRPRPTREPEDTSAEPTRKPSRKGAGRFTKEVFFGTNSVRLSKRNRTLLAANVRWLEANPEVSITVEGHTDTTGPAEYNTILGQRRADMVAAFLIEMGVAESRIEVVSRGEEDLAYDPQSSKNRRVLFVVK